MQEPNSSDDIEFTPRAERRRQRFPLSRHGLAEHSASAVHWLSRRFAVLVALAVVMAAGATYQLKYETAEAITATYFTNGEGTHTGWTNTEGTVDETGTASCSNDDSIHDEGNAVGDAKRSFTVDISGIANGTTIQSIDVVTWHREDDDGDDGTYRALIIFNGVETAGTTVRSPSGEDCVSVTETFNVADIVKSGATTLQIGVEKLDAGSDEVRIGAIRASITDNSLPPPAAPGTFDMSTPTDPTSTSDSTPDFNWTDSTGVVTYTLLISNDCTDSTFGGGDQTTGNVQAITGIVGSQHTLVTPLAVGNYCWKVLALNAGGTTHATNWNNSPGDNGSVWNLTITAPPVVPAPNPPFPVGGSCGLDMVLVLDTSTSISDAELALMKTAFVGFVNAFVGTPTQFSLVRFDDDVSTPQVWTGTAATIIAAINAANGDGFTNWELAFGAARDLYLPGGASDPTTNFNVVVFSSDGNPTASSAGANDTGQPNAHLTPAINAANLIKGDGTRILAIGIGDDLSTANLQAVSSMNATFTSGFAELAANLALLAKALCGGTVNIQKVIDADGNLGTPNDRTPAATWNFTVAVAPGDGDSIEGGLPTRTTAAVTGFTPSYKILTGPNLSASLTIDEEIKDGFSLLDVDCTGNASALAATVNTTTGLTSSITLGNQDTVTCVFINTALPQLSIQKVCTPPATTPGGGFTATTTGPTAVPVQNLDCGETVGPFTVAPGEYNVTESAPPAGWKAPTYQNCNPTLTAGQHVTCVITNALNSATFTVNKVYVGGDGPAVPITLDCVTGNEGPGQNADDPLPDAVFTVTGITGASTTCTATETAPPGYTQTNTTCTGVTLPANGSAECTITNTANSATFTVNKVYVGGDGPPVSITLDCVTGNEGPAQNADDPTPDAVFTVTGIVGASTTCTATETAPPGFAQTNTTCTGVTLPANGTAGCTITNTANSATFTVNKVYVGGDGPAVSIALDCVTGNEGPAQNADDPTPDAVFTVTGIVGASTTCTATETAPPGFAQTNTTCTGVTLPANGTAGCTITNTANSATFTVNKVYVGGDGPAVSISLDCGTGNEGGPHDADDPTPDAVFTVTGIVGASTTCTATETAPAGFTQTNTTCTGVTLPANGTASCEITNTANSASILVKKVYSPVGPVTPVSVTVNCEGGNGTVVTSPQDVAPGPGTTFTITGIEGTATCHAAEAVPPGYTANHGDCTTFQVPENSTNFECTITNTLNSATFTVNKVYVGGDGPAVSIALDCGSGTEGGPHNADDPTPDAVFTVTGIVGASTTCTATETAPPGFTQTATTCTGVTLPANGTASCTITNTLNSATFTVNKVYVGGDGPAVSIALDCGTGTEGGPHNADDPTPDAVFTVTGIVGTSTTCTATETAPPGFTQTATTCTGVTLPANGTASCTITNTLNSATFTVNKVYVGGDGPAVSIALDCGTGTEGGPHNADDDLPDAVFTVTGIVGASTTCTATETAPPGFTQTNTTCTGVTLPANGTAECTITNTANSATFTVNKVYMGGDGPAVSIALDCGSGTEGGPHNADDPTPDAVFTVTGIVGASTTCTATETAPPGFTQTNTTCTGVTLPANGTAECTITNTANSATFTVNKVYVGANGPAVSISLDCGSGTEGGPHDADDPTPDAVFTVTGIVGASTTCTATETAPPGFTQTNTTCTGVTLPANGTASCTITNTQNSATIEVLKDWSDDNPADVSVTLTCTDGTIVGAATRTITEGSGTIYTVVGFIPGNPSCTATEDLTDPDLVGYTTDESDCESVPLTVNGTESCTIFNTLQAIPVVGKVPNLEPEGGPYSVEQGTEFSYTIRVINQGDETADVLLEDYGLTGATIVSVVDDTDCTVVVGSDGFECEIFDLGPDEFVDFTVTVEANDTCVPINNNARVSLIVDEPTQPLIAAIPTEFADDIQSAQVNVTGCDVDLDVTKGQRLGDSGGFTTTTIEVEPGDEVQYRIVVRNDGDVILTDVVIEDPISGDLTLTEIVSDPDDVCDIVGGDLVCEPFDLEPGDSYTVIIEVEVEDCDLITNRANADAFELGTQQSNAVQLDCEVEEAEQPQQPAPSPSPAPVSQVQGTTTQPEPPRISQVLPTRLPATGSGELTTESGSGLADYAVWGGIAMVLALLGVGIGGWRLVARRR